MTAAGATWMRRRSSPSPAENGSRVEREWGSGVGNECWIDFYLMFGYWGGGSWKTLRLNATEDLTYKPN